MELCTQAPAQAVHALAKSGDPLAPVAGCGERAAGITVAMARFVGSAPTCVVNAGAAGAPCAAIWCIDNPRLRIGPLPFCILSFRKSGTAGVTKVGEKVRTYKRPRIGSATFIPDHTPSEWLLEGPCSALHVYIAPETLRAHALQGRATSMPRIEEFFAIEDPWLTSYFHLLIGEYETFASGAIPPDGLLLDQMQHFLVRHLVRWHSNSASAGRAGVDERRHVNSLRPFLVRRIHDFIDANLANDISLSVLAGLTSMSPGHFLRSFKAATGMTPYRCVLERRLSKASRLVRATAVPIATVARECGFRTPTYFTTRFHAHFGVSPMRYRDGNRPRN